MIQVIIARIKRPKARQALLDKCNDFSIKFQLNSSTTEPLTSHQNVLSVIFG